MNDLEITKELEKEFKSTFESAKGVVLSMDEKAVIKNRISSFVTHSITNPKKSSGFFSRFEHLSISSMYLVPALAILLMISGGTASFVAQQSLPGDTLYTLKLNVNENIESLLALSPESKAEVNLRQVSERLDEAEVLNLTNNLTEVNSQVIQENFSKKIDSINLQLEESKKTANASNTDLAVKAELELDKEANEHKNIFTAISNSASNSPILSKFLSPQVSAPDPTANVFAQAAIADDMSAKASNTRSLSPTVNTMAMTMEATTSSGNDLPEYTMKDVKRHKKSGDCWAVVSGNVYNFTLLIKKYPVGASYFKSMCGTDATKKFNLGMKGEFTINSQLEEYKVGVLK